MLRICIVALRIFTQKFTSESPPTKKWQLSSLESYHLSENTWKCTVYVIIVYIDILLSYRLDAYSRHTISPSACHPTCSSANCSTFNSWSLGPVNSMSAGVAIIWTAKNCMQPCSDYGSASFPSLDLNWLPWSLLFSLQAQLLFQSMLSLLSSHE